MSQEEHHMTPAFVPESGVETMSNPNTFEPREYALTIAQADAIAASGHALGSRGYGHETNPDSSCLSGGAEREYALITVATGGMGNHGTTYLRGRTPRARAIVRAGKVARLVADGIPANVASAAVSMQYGMELPVVSLAADIAPMLAACPSLANQLCAAESHAAFDRVCGFKPEELSFPRKHAAAAIAAKAAA